MRLFQDRRLSGAGTRACVTCHQPSLGWTDGRPRALSLEGKELARNTPTLWNLAYASAFMWDGRAATLEEQARLPIENMEEMGGTWPVLLERLQKDTGLAADFARAFPGTSPTVSQKTVLEALAAFERTLVSPPTRFDLWLAGDPSALSEEEAVGFRLFVGRAGCVGCHAGWRFTDDAFHDIGLGGGDPGRGALPEGIPGLAAFKTPSLRDLRFTAPYMHDGTKATLADVLNHYTDGIAARSGGDPRLVRPLRLDGREKAALLSFLLTLSSRAIPATPFPPSAPLRP